MEPSANVPPSSARSLDQLVFVGFRSRVVALDRDSGDLVWEWKSPAGRYYVALLVDGDRLIVSVQGYTYCLDPLTGAEVWRNALKGFGIGVPSISSVNGSSSHPALAEVQREQAQRNASSAGATPH